MDPSVIIGRHITAFKEGEDICLDIGGIVQDRPGERAGGVCLKVDGECGIFQAADDGEWNVGNFPACRCGFLLQVLDGSRLDCGVRNSDVASICEGGMSSQSCRVEVDCPCFCFECQRLGSGCGDGLCGHKKADTGCKIDLEHWFSSIDGIYQMGL